MATTIGHGTQFELGNGATPTEVFTAITGVLDVTFGSNKVDTHDVTDLGVSGTARVFITGLENSGDVTVKLNAKPGDTTQLSLYTAKDGNSHNFKVIYPGATKTRSFAGLVVGWDETIPDDKIPTYTVKIQITGAITNS